MKTHIYKNQNVWIIGASSGIGRALAKELHNRGAKLYLSARSEDKLKELNKELGSEHNVVPLDVSKKTIVKNTATQIIEKCHGKLHRVIFLAATYAPGTTDDMKTSDIDKTIDVNLKGAFYLVNALLPLMERGQITLCGSVAGYRGLPNGQPYCATKAAIINLAESLRIEYQDKGLDIRLISPGFVKTPLTDKNTFEMPMIIEADEAAEAIADGLIGNSFEIHFPKKFTYIMKVLKVLPHWLYFPLAKAMRDRS